METTPYLAWDWRLPNVNINFPTESEAEEYQEENSISDNNRCKGNCN